MLSAVATKDVGRRAVSDDRQQGPRVARPATVKVLGKRIRSAVTKELVRPSYLSYNAVTTRAASRSGATAVGQVPHDEAEGPGALGHDPEAPALEQVGS